MKYFSQRVATSLWFVAVFFFLSHFAAAQDGVLDSSFDTDGIVTTTIGSSSELAEAVAIQTDGKIIIAGNYFNGSNTDIIVVRYNSDGSLDTDFGTGGKVTTAVGSSLDNANDIALQSDGKIVVAGSSIISGVSVFAVVRYNSDGSLDTDFGTGGKVTTPIGTIGSEGNCLAIRNDGKIIVAGISYEEIEEVPQIAVVRYLSNGIIDSSFNDDGIVITVIGSSDDEVLDVAVQNDGKIVAAGFSDNGSKYNVVVIRYNNDGSLDTGFNGDGIVTSAIGASNDNAQSIALQNDGKIVVAGSSYNGSDDDIAVIRYNTDGTLDTGFGGDGIVTTSIGSLSDAAYSIALQSDGKILITGLTGIPSNRDIVVVRYDNDGALDSGFGSGGTVTTAVGSSHEIGYDIAIQNDGGIVVVGKTVNGGSNDIVVLRYTGSSGPLPVELVSFTAAMAGKNAELKWNTATEVNNAGFEIERAINNGQLTMENWKKIGFVGGNGTSNTPKQYSYIDGDLHSGKYSYRLKQIDRDGKFKYSQEVEVTISSVPNVFALEQNFPNPFNPSTTIGFTLQVSGPVSLKVYDAIGREVAALVNEVKEAGSYSASFNGSKLSSGIYFARLWSGNNVLLKKMLLIK